MVQLRQRTILPYPPLAAHCVFRYDSGYSNHARVGAADSGYKEIVRVGNDGSHSHTR
jgi:hypothetical protein